MKKKLVIFITILFVFFVLTGCSSRSNDLELLEQEIYLKNRNISELVEEYNKNIVLYNELNDEILDYLYQEEMTMPKFEKYMSSFSDYDMHCNVLDTMHQKIVKTLKKAELDIDLEKSSSFSNAFLDTDNGSLVGYYYLSVGNTVMHAEIIFQDGMIYSVTYEM